MLRCVEVELQALGGFYGDTILQVRADVLHVFRVVHKACYCWLSWLEGSLTLDLRWRIGHVVGEHTVVADVSDRL